MKQVWMWCALIVAGTAPHFLLTSSVLALEEDKPATSAAPVLANEGHREKEAEELKRLQEFFLRNQSVFIRKGEVIVEFNNFYNHDRRQELVPVGPEGAAVVETTRRIFESSLFARVGIATGLEIDVRVPYLVHATQTTNVGTGDFTTSSTGFGDVAVFLRYQAWYERGIMPSIMFDINGKTRTAQSSLLGTGGYSVGGGMTILKSIDPVYFFARVGYVETLASAGRNLGNSIDYSVGMGFSLNDRVAFNLQYVGALTGQAKINNVAINNSSLEIGGLNFSSTILITKKLFIEPLVGIGMTKDAFDSVIGVRIPYRF